MSMIANADMGDRDVWEEENRSLPRAYSGLPVPNYGEQRELLLRSWKGGASMPPDRVKWTEEQCSKLRKALGVTKESITKVIARTGGDARANDVYRMIRGQMSAPIGLYERICAALGVTL